MPVVTHASLLFDAAAAPEPAAALEADLAAAWARCKEAATAEGGLTWPVGVAAGDAGAALAFVAAGAQPDAPPPDTAVRAITAAPSAGASAACASLASLAGVHWSTLTAETRGRVAAAVASLVAARAPGSDTAALATLRHVRSACTSPSNVALAATVVGGVASAFDFVVSKPALAHAALLACLRLLPELARVADGGNALPTISALRDTASGLAARLLSEAWPVAAGAGRDLVPALRDVAALAPFDTIWKALMEGYVASGDDVDTRATATPPATPSSPHALASLLATRTPPRALLSRLPPDAEAALYFMLTSVRSGNQRRYQSWYAARHVADDAPPDAAAATAAADGAVADAVRYIVSVYHPPNAVLTSDVLPRWAALGWLTQLPRSAAGGAAARAALVLDWLFYTPSVDSFMNVEPAALLLLQSIPKYAAVSNGVLEFVSAAVERFVPAAATRARRGLAAGADALVARGVLKNFDRLATAPEVAPELRERVRELFGGVVSGGVVVSGGMVSGGDAATAATTTTTTTKRRRAPSPPPTDAPKKRRAVEDDKAEAKPGVKDAAPPPPKADPPPPPPTTKPTTSSPVDTALADLKAAVTATPTRADALLAAASALLAAACPSKKPSAARKKPATDTPPLDAAAAGVAALADTAAAGSTTAPWSEPPDAGAPSLPRFDPATLCGALVAAALAPDAPAQEASASLFASLRTADACADVGWRLLGAVAAAAEDEAAEPKDSSSSSSSPTDAALTLYACSSPDPRAALEADVGAALATAGPRAVAGAAPALLRALGEPPPLPALRLLLASADAACVLTMAADLATRRGWFVLPGEEEEEAGSGGRRKRGDPAAALATATSRFVGAVHAWPHALAARAWRLLADDAGGRGVLDGVCAAALSALATRPPRGGALAAAAPVIAAATPTPDMVAAVLALPAAATPFALAVLGRWCGGGGGGDEDDEPPAPKKKGGKPAKSAPTPPPPPAANAGVAAAAAALKVGLAKGGGGRGATVGEVWGV